MERTTTELPSPEEAPTLLHWTVVCPERQRLAEIEIVTRAAPFATFCCPHFTVRHCSFWPEDEACQRACLHSGPETE
jgi:hypothetical protein